MPDPSLPPSTPPWCVRHRAAALVTHGGRVLLHQLDGDSFWALPGGAIEPGESACDALARELQEELGADRGTCIAVGSLAVVAENFFAYGGVSYHEIGLFLRAFLGDFLKQEPAGVLHIVHRDTPPQKTDGTAGAHQHTALTTG